MAVTSLVFGILSIVFSFIPVINWLGFIFGVVGIILGAIAKKKGTGPATAGLVLSIIGTALCAVLYIACVACIGCAGAM